MIRHICRLTFIITTSYRYHKVGNPSKSIPAVTMHLYCPPFNQCKIWLDPSHASRPSKACMCTYSEYGLKHTCEMFEVNMIWCWRSCLCCVRSRTYAVGCCKWLLDCIYGTVMIQTTKLLKYCRIQSNTQIAMYWWLQFSNLLASGSPWRIAKSPSCASFIPAIASSVVSLCLVQ